MRIFLVSPSSVDLKDRLEAIAKVKLLGLEIIDMVVSDHQVELHALKFDIDLSDELQRF